MWLVQQLYAGLDDGEAGQRQPGHNVEDRRAERADHGVEQAQQEQPVELKPSPRPERVQPARRSPRVQRYRPRSWSGRTANPSVTTAIDTAGSVLKSGIDVLRRRASETGL